MKDRIVAILRDASEVENDVFGIPNLISGGYLDSFATLMLINGLEMEFGVTFDFDDDLIENLDSVEKIEGLLKRKLNHA